MLRLPRQCKAVPYHIYHSRHILASFSARGAFIQAKLSDSAFILAATMSTASNLNSNRNRSTGPPQPPVPRPSASLIVVNPRNEILLVQRNPKASAFGGMQVFPGGNLDKAQDSSLAITAIRETFEESGLLLASPADGGSSRALSERELDDARFAVHQQKMSFNDFLAEHGLEADVSSLLPFTEWVTPVGPPKRFRTQFYVTFLKPSPLSSSFSSGAKEERVPTPDGGQEVIAAQFIQPEKALAAHVERKMMFMPPQFYILSTLADILTGPETTAEQKEQVKRLSEGAFGRMTINPRGVGKTEDGRTILAYEGDESRGGVKGRLHRALVSFEKTTPSQVTLVRNFDIFKDIDHATFSGAPASKL